MCAGDRVAGAGGEPGGGGNLPQVRQPEEAAGADGETTDRGGTQTGRETVQVFCFVAVSS